MKPKQQGSIPPRMDHIDFPHYFANTKVTVYTGTSAMFVLEYENVVDAAV
jgi:hypothetical protein